MTKPQAAPEVVSLGECLVALVAASTGPLAEVRQFDAHVAGTEANVLVGMARLGRSTAFIGRVGDDGFGTSIVRRLRSEGVNVDGLSIDPEHPTGILVRARTHVGPAELRYFRTDSAGAHLAPEDVARHVELIRGARLLHVTGITPALSDEAAAAVDAAIDAARGAGCLISMDVNYRRRLWDEATARAALLPIAARVDVLVAGPDEGRLLTGPSGAASDGDLARSLQVLGPRIAVVKDGATGATAVGPGGDVVSGPALTVATVVDPIGAGDAFTAGLLAAILDDVPLPEALRWANACGAAAVASHGDMTGMPTRMELDRLLADTATDTLR